MLGGNNPPGNLIGQRTAVITSVSDIETLPTNYEALPVISAKVNAKLDLSDYMSFIAEVYYTRNANRTTFQDDVAGIAEPSFEKPDGVGFNVIMQARF